MPGPCPPPARRRTAALFATLAVACAARGPAAERPVPVASGTCVVVGILGGWDARDDSTKGVRRLALRLREPGRVVAETFENRRAGVAAAYVRGTLDADRDGRVAAPEAAHARLVLYGQSLGGGAAVALARRLLAEAVPVNLLLLVDSVGWNDGVVPPNVRAAANLYQDDGLFIAGERPIRARDTAATRILGEWEYEYDEPPGSEIRIDDLAWHETAFRAAHARMDRDPRVWARAEALIRAACAGGPPGG